MIGEVNPLPARILSALEQAADEEHDRIVAKLATLLEEALGYEEVASGLSAHRRRSRILVQTLRSAYQNISGEGAPSLNGRAPNPEDGEHRNERLVAQLQAAQDDD
jgi:hypothetical protein